jgi:hypothetical protein
MPYYNGVFYTDEQMAAARAVLGRMQQQDQSIQQQNDRLAAIEQAPSNAEFNARYESARQKAHLSEAAMVDVTNRAMADGIFSPEIAVRNYSGSSWNLFDNMLPEGTPQRRAANAGNFNEVADILRRNIGG